MGVVWVFYGPTGVGKTKFLLELGEYFDFEVISADSRQVYKELTVGTAKPTVEETGIVKHHLIDFLSPTLRYDAFSFKKDAEELLRKSEKKMVICGGTGFYIASFVYNFSFFGTTPHPDFRRNALEREQRDPGWLFSVVSETHPKWAKKIGPMNIKRLLRAYEILTFSEEPVPDPP